MEENTNRRGSGPPYFAKSLDIFNLIVTLLAIGLLLVLLLSERQAQPPASAATPPIGLPSITSPLPGSPFDMGKLGEIAGTAAAGATVALFDGSEKIGETIAGADGKWTFKLPELTPGEHTLIAKVTGADGKELASPELKIAIPEVGLAGLKIVTPTIDLPTTGISLTLGNLGSISGIASPNSDVSIFDGDKQIGQVTADANGTWTFSLPDLSAGLHSLLAKVTGVDGNEVMSPVVPIMIAAEAASKDLAAGLPAINLPASGISFTLGSGVEISGTAAPGSTVTIYDGDKQIGEATANADGAWVFKLPELRPGALSLIAKSLDASGNEIASAPIPVTIETPAGEVITATLRTSAPSIHLPTTGITVTVGKVNEITGTAAPSSTVEVFDGDEKLGEATADENGNWKFEVPDLKPGLYSIQVKATDADGQEVSSPPVVVSVSPAGADASASPGGSAGNETTAPAIESLETGASLMQGNLGSLSGSAAPGSRLQVFSNGRPIGQVTADGSGGWSFELPQLRAGEQVITVKDDQGRTSAEVPINVLTQLRTPSITGIRSDGLLSVDNAGSIKGTASPSSTVQVFDGDEKIGETTADANGQWTLELSQPLAAGEHSLSAVASYSEANAESARSKPIDVQVVTTPLLPTTGEDLSER